MISGNTPSISAAACASAIDCDRARLSDIQADLQHRLLEKLAVLALRDGVGLRADHLDAVFLQDARAVELHRRGSAPSGRPGSAAGAEGRSVAMIFSTNSTVSGSM
jgi:hypothetical protein